MFPLRPLDDLRDLMRPHRLQQNFPAQHSHRAEHFRKGLIGKLHTPGFIQHQHAFDHAVEQRILARDGFTDD